MIAMHAGSTLLDIVQIQQLVLVANILHANTDVL